MPKNNNNKAEETTAIEQEVAATPATHYVDNNALYKACLEYHNKVKEAEAAGLPKPRIPNYIGDCLLKIATKLSYSRKFVNYPFRDEMVLDGVENCCLYFHNFDPTKYSHPFNYFTTVVYYAFLRRIHREKKQMYIRHKAMFNMIDEGLAETMQFDDSFKEVNIDEKITNNDYMKDFVENFERKTEEKRKKRVGAAKRRREGLDQFIDEPVDPTDELPPELYKDL